jgi:ADP-heptose:LPS heptosyltransferase
MEILKHNPFIDRVHLLREPILPRFLSLWRALSREQFDAVLIFHSSQRLTLPLCSILGASQIVGTASLNKGLDSLLTDALPNDFQHEIVRRLKMVERIGGQASSETVSLFLKPEERTAVLPPGKWIALHPGSKDGFKRWPTENFGAVGRALKEKLGCEILITGTKAEKPLMEEVAALIPGAHLGDANLSFRSFASLLQQVDLLISNDTGPVHVACALQRPVVALYSSTDPHLCGPHKAANAVALYKKRTCDPCLKRQCRRPFCLLQIGVAEVVEAAEKLLRKIWS